MKKTFKIILFIFLVALLNINKITCDNYYARTIFVPRQLSYNPIFENAQKLNIKKAMCSKEQDNRSIASKIILSQQAIQEKDNIDLDQAITVKNVNISQKSKDQETKDAEFKQAEYLLSKFIDPFSLDTPSTKSNYNPKKLKQSKIITNSPSDLINKKIIDAMKKIIIQNKTKPEAINLEQENQEKEIIKNIQSQEKLAQETIIEKEKPLTEIVSLEKPLTELAPQEKPAPEVIKISNLDVLEKENTKNNNLNFIFSVKPIYTQNIGSKFQQYFNLDHKCRLNVQQNGSGDVDSLWFKVKGSDGNFYSSCLSFCPKRQTYGSMLYFAAALPRNLEISINTAILQTRNNIHIYENNIQSLCTTCTDGFDTITQSFISQSRLFNKICGTQKKTGLDDIQIKLTYAPAPIKIGCSCECCHKRIKGSKRSINYQSKYLAWDIYGLLGIPTGRGSQAKYLFEPLIGSKHAQLGFGANIDCDIAKNDHTSWSILSEFKYRYAFAAEECRTFDLKYNCQWSRYLLFVNESNKYATYPAVNDLTFRAKVKPRSSLDLYIATHIDHKSWNFELGYDVWSRSPEKIKLCCKNLPTIGIADLKGIAANNPKTAHATNISQGITPGINQMVSDQSFTPITIKDISRISGAMESSLSNSFYGSIGYAFETKSDNKILLGINASYERGSYIDTPDNVSTWLNCDFYF